MAQDKEAFLRRWSRLKSETQVEKKEEKDDPPVPALPSVDKLTPESDFTGFMHPKVEDALRRSALKKLFSDPQFNVPDPYEAYSGDWTGGEPISEEMLATLNQARTLIFDEQKKADAPADAPLADAEAAQEKPTDDEPRGKG